MHSTIFRVFFRSVFQQHVVPSASHNTCLLESVHHWLNVKVTPVPFKPQMGSNPYLFKVLTNILSQYPNLDSSSYPHTGKGILLVLGFFFNYSNMKDMRMLIRAMYHVLIEWSSQCRIEDLKKSLRIRSSAATTM